MISNKELDSFIEKFNYLHSVAKKLKVIHYTENDFLKFRDEGESERTSLVDSEGYLVNSPDTRLFRGYFSNVSFDVSKEVEQNLYLLSDKDNRIIYAKNVLRRFKNASLYLDMSNDVIHEGNEFFKTREEELLIQSCARTLKKVVFKEELHIEKLTHWEFYLQFLWARLIKFANEFANILFSFHIILNEIEDEVSVYICSGILKNSPGIAFRLMGYGHSEIDKYYFCVKEELPSPFQLQADLSQTIVDYSEIKNLRGCFDGFLWEKEEISDIDFFRYWIVGPKDKYLPIKNKQITSFLYLYFGYINKTNKAGKFTFTHAITEATFNVEDVKGKKTKINTSTQGVIFIKKHLGPPVYKIQG